MKSRMVFLLLVILVGSPVLAQQLTIESWKRPQKAAKAAK